MKLYRLVVVLCLIAGCDDRASKKESPSEKEKPAQKTVETKPEPKPESVPESKPEPKPVVKTEPKPEPKPEGKTDEEWKKLLVGKWDGMQIKKTTKGQSGNVTGILKLVDGGHMTFDGSASGKQQLIANGSWTVTNGQLTFIVESSNAPRMIPNGTSGVVKIREVTEREFLYIDLTDMRTYSALRVK
jgi:hypothetical protein